MPRINDLKWTSVALASIVCMQAGTCLATDESEAQKLNAFYTAQWDYELEHHPDMATYVGDARFNDRLADHSAAAAASEAAHNASQLKRLRGMSAAGLDEQQTISREMMLRHLEASLDSYRLKEWEMPVSQINGLHLDLAAMYSSMPFRNAQDYRNYNARLRQIPRVFDQEIAVMRLGMRDHLVQPRFLLEKVVLEAQDIASKTPEESPFAVPLKNFPAGVGADEQQALRKETLAIVAAGVLPAFAHFAIFVRDEYAPRGRADPGIWALPNGDALYRNAIREHVQTTMDADAIFNEGVREVGVIRAQMVALAKAQGYDDLSAFNAHIQSDPQLHGTTGEQILALYKHYEDQSWKRLDQVLPVPPTAPLEVVPMDGFRSANAVPADYSPGSNAGGRPGRVNVNMYRPTDRLLLNVEAIAYHEGVPGHHLQFSFADGLKDLPAFRQFASYDAYSEGWALYAEQLGKELGFYQDPYSEYGRLQNEMWRAIRLVVDTGVHWKHWTRAQMVDFFQQNTAMDAQNIQTEVDRYISWPGQALSYRLGQQKILELRERAQTRLGGRYDIRQFHARVLSLGPVPLDVMDASVTRWIDDQVKQAN